jgi:hypothetical protein
MGKRIMFLLAVCTGIVLVGISVSAETFHYHETIERGDDYISRWTIEEKNGRIHLTILTNNSEQVYKCLCTDDGAVKEFSIFDPDADTDFLAWREGNTVNFVGTVEGDKKSKKFTVEDLPWGQPIPILLKEQFHKLDSGLEFWILDINKGRPIYLQAKKVNSGRISVLDETYPAHHIEIRLRGGLSAFWVSNYWIHARTRDFLKFEGDFGPGSRKTITELMDIN